MPHCTTCDLITRRDEGTAPLWDSIHRTEYWDVAHCNNTSLSGWLVLVIRRHIAAIDEMTEAEAVELGRLIRRAALALRQEVGCARTYVAQFAEAPGHQHVHFHIIPRMPDQPEDDQGPRIFRRLNVPAEERVDEATMDEIARGVRRRLLSNA